MLDSEPKPISIEPAQSTPPAPGMGDQSSPPEMSDMETRPFLLCPKCYFRNTVDASECSKCNTSLRGPSKPTSTPAEGGPKAIGNRIDCPSCGTDNPAEVISCKQCNYNFLKKTQIMVRNFK